MIDTEQSLIQEHSLYNENVPYPNPKSVIEQLSNYQHVINQLKFKMFEFMAKNDIDSKDVIVD